MTIQLPTLAQGEVYLGALGDQDGNLTHIILLPGDYDEANHTTQVGIGVAAGGVLPNKAELALAWTNARDEFRHEWYWSGQTYERNSAFAWCQIFGDGTQNTQNKETRTARARFVRRVPA
ncbi:DUF1566 domain-containing protein [Bordetella hinzii]|uniref:DUF1566 domain-containing protein n=1 Tax=Bordetella hinzii TaxID=103855 RepID=UPI0039FD1A7B